MIISVKKEKMKE